MVLAAGNGIRMRPLTERMPKPLIAVGGKPLLDNVLDRLAATGVETAIVNVHYLADQIERHLAARRAPRIVISDERAELLDTGGGVVKALPILGTAPFYHLNSDTIWIDGVKSNLVRLAESFDAARMDALLLLAATSNSVGYAGRGDFGMAPDGRLQRRPEREVAPFVYAGVAILSPGLVRRCAGRGVLAQPPVRPRHRSRPPPRPAARRRVDARRHPRRHRRRGSRDPRQRGVIGVADQRVATIMSRIAIDPPDRHR